MATKMLQISSSRMCKVNLVLKAMFFIICAFHASNMLLFVNGEEMQDLLETTVAGESQEKESRVFFQPDPVHSSPGAGMMKPNMNMTMEVLNMIFTQLPVLKLSILSAVMNATITSLHVILILSLILFSLAATAALICSVFDCHNGFGLFSRSSYQHRPFSSILKKNFRNANGGNGHQPPPGYYTTQAQQWSMQDPAHNLIASNLDEGLEKWGDQQAL